MDILIPETEGMDMRTPGSRQQAGARDAGWIDFLSYEVLSMEQNYTAVVKQDGDWWIGWIEEVPGVNCQEASREELLESLRITLAEAIEFNRTEARSAAGRGYEELPIAV